MRLGAASNVMTDEPSDKVIQLLEEIRDLTKQRNEMASQTRQAIQQQIDAVARRQAEAAAEAQARRWDDRKKLYVSVALVFITAMTFIALILLLARPR